MAGTMVQFPTNGTKTAGYLATPAERQGSGRDRDPGVVGPRAAHQERLRPLRRRGVHGARAGHVPRQDRQRARRSRQALHGPQHRARPRRICGARPTYLAGHSSTAKLGAVGFCMGGQLALFAATLNPSVGACVNFYGIHPNVKPDYSKLSGPVLGLFAEKDGFVTPQVAQGRRRRHQEGRQAVGDPHLSGRGSRVLQRRAARRLQQDARPTTPGGARWPSSAST